MRVTIEISKVYKAVTDGELEITPSGEIWRIQKRGWDSGERRAVSRPCKRVRAEHKTGLGYLQIRVMYELKRMNMQAHRLIYFHFYGDIPAGLTVNHKNGKKSDNHPDNLELMTDKEQVAHSRGVLKRGRLNQNGEKNCMAKLTDSQVIEIKARRLNGEKLNAVAKDYGISYKTVSKIAKGQRWTHL